MARGAQPEAQQQTPASHALLETFMLRTSLPTCPLALVALLTILAPCASAQEPELAPEAGFADRVLFGRVLTMDAARPTAEAVVVRRGRIAAVTSRTLAERWIGPETKVLEAPPSGAILPGIIDSHAHLIGIGQRQRTLDLSGVPSLEELLSRTQAASGAQDSDWLLGRGWNHELWPEPALPDRSALDRLFPKRPVALTRVDGHAIFVNGAALRAAGITRQTPNPKGGEILRRPDGEATGVLVDNAMGLLAKALPSDQDPETLAADFLAAQAEAFALGVTTVMDAGMTPAVAQTLKTVYLDGRAKLRVQVMLSVNTEDELAAATALPPLLGLYGDRVNVRSLKLYADGALGSRGAWLLEPYRDRPAHTGLPVVDPAFVELAARTALLRGYQVCVHAIGDRAIRETLDAFERAFVVKENARLVDHRFRIEHVQICDPADVPRFGELGVIASMQGCHCTSDAPWVADRLGSERALEKGYLWRSLLDSGTMIANGTDAPVESFSPWTNLWSTLTRQYRDREGRWQVFRADQRLNRLEALRTMTWHAAHACFREDAVGRLRPGMHADMIILDRNPMRANAWELSRARPLMTMVAGEVVYERETR